MYMLDAAHETDFALRPRRPSGSDPGQLGYFAVTGPHVISAARHLLGELEQITAHVTRAPVDPRTLRPRDTDMSISVRFVSGAVGTLRFSGRIRHKGDPVRTIRVLGSEGWVRFDPFTAIGEWADRDGRHRIELPAFSAGHAETISHFVACCRTGRQPVTSFADQARTVAAVDAVYKSVSAETAAGTDSAGAP
jgi:predicted dehydrogenase